MKAIIEVDVPDYQIGQEVSIYFKDTMMKKGVVQEPKTGHWIWDSKSNVYRCSCCNQFPWRINTEENDEVFIDMKRTNAYKFCPNCGARMVEQESEE